jgi:TonB family protein
MLCAVMLCAAWIVLSPPLPGGVAVAQKQAARAERSAVELLKIVNLVEPGYPPSMTWQGIISGGVDLVFGVDGEGRLDDYLITSYTRAEFAREVEAALKQWRFEPMRIDGVPVWSRAELSFSFEARGVVITRTVIDGVTMLTGSMLKASDRVNVLSKQSELDHPLVVANAVAPLYPAELAESGRAGEVMVEFFVDEQGRVRLPVVEGEAHPWFADAAARAVMQWRFEPPMKKGWPTVVKVRQPFVFNAQ